MDKQLQNIIVDSTALVLSTDEEGKALFEQSFGVGSWEDAEEMMRERQTDAMSEWENLPFYKRLVTPKPNWQ